MYVLHCLASYLHMWFAFTRGISKSPFHSLSASWERGGEKEPPHLTNVVEEPTPYPPFSV